MQKETVICTESQQQDATIQCLHANADVLRVNIAVRELRHGGYIARGKTRYRRDLRRATSASHTELSLRWCVTLRIIGFLDSITVVELLRNRT
jgi:hypothetical protein